MFESQRIYVIMSKEGKKHNLKELLDSNDICFNEFEIDSYQFNDLATSKCVSACKCHKNGDN